MSMEFISFIIPAFNAEDYIERCLQCIAYEMEEGDEIILVDNGSIDRTLFFAETFTGARVRVLELPEATLAGLRNSGAREALNDILAFIDSDCLLQPGWRAAAIDTLVDSSIAATGGRPAIPEVSSWIERAWSAQRHSTPRDVNFISSGNFVIRRANFFAVHGFDESMGTDEDVDLGNRLCNAGYLLVDNPAVHSIHLGNPKTLVQFARQTAWRARGNTNLISHGTLDRPVLMTYLYLICILACLPMILFSLLAGFPIWVAIVMFLSVPLVTTALRTAKFGIYQRAIPLFVLFIVYYVARVFALTGLSERYWKQPTVARKRGQ